MNRTKTQILLSTCLALCTAPFAVSHAAPFTTIYRFPTSGEQGTVPVGPLVLGADGNFYGETYDGAYHSTPDGAGTVFKVTPQGQLTTLHFFTGQPDGQYPSGGLIFDKAGNLYGVTREGGSSANLGTVFKIAPDGAETILHAFLYKNDGSEGEVPNGGLTSDDAGNLYGVTEGGGRHGAGTVFEITPAGVETILHDFDGTDGASPSTRLFRDKDGTLYGTTAGDARDNAGTVFRLNVNGAFKVLHKFSTSNLAGGKTPGGGVVLGRGGFLYGTTIQGGKLDWGVVYRIKRDGSEEAVIYSFTGGASGNGYPEDTLTIDAKGNFYGTTGNNGGQGADVGAVFKLKRSGDEKVLHTLTKADGYFPTGALAYDASGNLYGTTEGAPGQPNRIHPVRAA